MSDMQSRTVKLSGGNVMTFSWDLDIGVMTKRERRLSSEIQIALDLLQYQDEGALQVCDQHFGLEHPRCAVCHWNVAVEQIEELKRENQRYKSTLETINSVYCNREMSTHAVATEMWRVACEALA
jgi:acyl-ACP thioesterase